MMGRLLHTMHLSVMVCSKKKKRKKKINIEWFLIGWDKKHETHFW